jgi:hypothetical protein
VFIYMKWVPSGMFDLALSYLSYLHLHFSYSLLFNFKFEWIALLDFENLPLYLRSTSKIQAFFV